MSGFRSRCVLALADKYDDGQWVLVEPLVYQSDRAGMTITVPAGFQTDLASVPRWPVIFFLCGDTSNEAAIVHDYLYSTHMVPRDVADGVLSEASRASGVPAWRASLMWAGVRLFGSSHWGNNVPAITSQASP